MCMRIMVRQILCVDVYHVSESLFGVQKSHDIYSLIRVRYQVYTFVFA